MAKNGKRLGFLPGWRILTYVILLFNLLMLAWIIGGASSVSDNCAGETEFKDACEAGTAVGAGVAIFMIIFLWALGDIILGVIWLVTNKKKTRDCPICGHDVKKGVTQCAKCGHDFRGVTAGVTA